MTQELGLLAEAPAPEITFVPHYIPMTRGILSTCYAELRAGVTLDRDGIKQLYREFYADAPFVHVSDTPPSTKHVAGHELLRRAPDASTSRRGRSSSRPRSTISARARRARWCSA